MKIEAKAGKPSRGSWADTHNLGGGAYKIVYHKDLDGFKLAVILFHELLHCLAWERLPFSKIENEHKFIEAMERSFRRHAQKFWIGEKER